MSLKIYILGSYLNIFPENLAAVTKEGERFHQDTSLKEKRCQRKLLADDCWRLKGSTGTLNTGKNHINIFFSK